MTVAILREEALEVDPGDSVSTQMTVYNSSPIVEQFSLEVLGDAAEWAELTPPVVSLFPNAQQDVTVTFSPPRQWHVPPGPVPFGVRVTPSNDPQGAVVEEGSLTVGHYSDLSAELIPQVTTGRRSGKLGIAIDHRGNMPFPVVLRGRDPADALVVTVKPAQLVLEPGQAAFAKLKVTPRKHFLRGPERQARFKVFVEPQVEDVEPVVLDATLIQKPTLPKGSVPIMVILGLVLLWFMVLRPVVRDTATAAIKPAIASQQAQNAAVAQSLAQTNSSIAALNSTAASLAKALSSTTTTAAPTTTTTASAPAPTTTPTTAPSPATTTSPFYANGNANNGGDIPVAPGTSTTVTIFTVPAGDTVSLVDLSVQNDSASNNCATSTGMEVRVERIPAGSRTASPLYYAGCPNPTYDHTYQQPAIFNPGDSLVVFAHCSPGDGACAVNVVADGTETAPATTTTTVLGG